MAVFDFFKEKIKSYADTAAKSAVSEINESLAEAGGRLRLVINESLVETSERLRRIETKQKETSIQLEEIDELLQRNDKNSLLEALITLTDTIGDFYFFAVADMSSPLFEQAQMMWNSAKSAAETAGLEVIIASNEPVNFNLHAIENAEQNADMPNGYVVKTLKCGYIYQNEIVRRAVVTVNRNDALDNNIIIFREGI
jgi:molecular chaperone GrpE (heat shock protein)